MIGTSSPISFCEISELFRICVDRSVLESMAPITEHMTPHDRLTRYLTATGWLAPTDPGPAGGLWRHPQSELLLPVPNDLVEDGIDWQRLVERLALVEEAAVADVLARLDGRMVDIANLRAANDIVISDTIPFTAGVTLVREGWTMLRASATTSLGPRPFIRRYRPAVALVRCDLIGVRRELKYPRQRLIYIETLCSVSLRKRPAGALQLDRGERAAVSKASPRPRSES